MVHRRREYLYSCVVGGVGVLTGCLGDSYEPECADDERVHNMDVSLENSASWPTYQYDAANTGANSEATVSTTGVDVAWRYPACSEGALGIAVAPQSVYAGTMILDGVTGERQAGNSDGSEMTPTIHNEMLYLSTGSAVEARNPDTGETLWTTGDRFSDTETLTVSNEAVYVVAQTADSADPTLYGLDARTGNSVWNYALGNQSNTVPAVANSTVYIIDRFDTIYAVENESGAEQWQESLDSRIRAASPAVANETVYLTTLDGGVIALHSSDGSERWRRDFGSRFETPVAVTNDTLFITDDTGGVRSLNATDGTTNWEVNKGSDSLSTPSVADGVVLVGVNPPSGQAPLIALDTSDGTELWRFNTRELIYGDYPRTGVVHAIPVGNGVVYVSTSGGDVYALVDQSS